MINDNVPNKKKKPASILSHMEMLAGMAPQTLPGPYDISNELEKVIARLISLEEFSHIKQTALIISLTQCRNSSSYGVYAAVRPLRFTSGALEMQSGKYKYVWQRFVIDGFEKLYQVAFYIPRFLDITFDEKLQTIIHELYHISPRLNGDLRRFPGKNYAHGHSRKEYDSLLNPIKEKALKTLDLRDFDFMNMKFKELRNKYGSIVGNFFKNLQPRRFLK